jgi:PBP1b-binding outer membrane lipoprotein LpoB
MSFMSGGGGKAAAAQAAQANEMQREQIAKQEATVAKQEAGVAAEQTVLAERAMAANRARRRGGLRGLLSTERADAEQGLPMRTTLGSGL